MLKNSNMDLFNPKTDCNSQKGLIKHTTRPDDL